MKLKDAAELLSRAGIENALGDARTIFERLGGAPRYLLISPDFECECEDVIDAVKRRAEREPLQYIIGEVDFYNETYKVTPDCLIPRADTEILVDYAVKNLPIGAVFLDLCTGSGCIAVSVLKNTEATKARAFDISRGALAIARENADKNGVGSRITFEQIDLMNGIPSTDKVFAVLSNPPYVSKSAYDALDAEIFAEPKGAFVGGDDGGDFYRSFVPTYKELIAKDGFMAFEIGYDQGALLLSLAEENGLSAEIIKDLCGNDRVAVLKHK